MLPRETTVRQLKKMREETKGKDIGDLTVNDRMNKNLPNLQYIGNPVDMGIESWEEFSKRDNKLQTIAFKSKLVNKPLVKENKKEIMENKINNVLSFQDFDKNWKPEESKKTKRTEVAKDILKEDVEKFEAFYNVEDLDDEDLEDLEGLDTDDLDNLEDDNVLEFEDEDDIDENVKTFEAFSLKDVDKKEVKQPEYTILGEEKEPKSNPLFGIGAVKDQENKKIAWFNNFVIDPKTPKERPILNAGQFINTEKVKGYINRIEGNKVYVESLDEPTKIVEISIKDAVKPPIEQKEELNKFNEIVDKLNKEYLK